MLSLHSPAIRTFHKDYFVAYERGASRLDAFAVLSCVPQHSRPFFKEAQLLQDKGSAKVVRIKMGLTSPQEKYG